MKLKRMLAPENGADFEHIVSFATENYIGVWDHCSNGFLLIAKEDSEFACEELGNFDTLDELDDAVYIACDEHIKEVFESSAYKITLIDE